MSNSLNCSSYFCLIPNLYQNLAHKASTFGNTQLIEILERLFIESDKLNSLFEEALTILEKNENE